MRGQAHLCDFWCALTERGETNESECYEYSEDGDRADRSLVYATVAILP